MRLGIITGDLAARDADGNIWMQHGVGRLWEALRERIPDTHLCTSFLPNRPEFLTHRLDFPPHTVVPLPPMPTTVMAQRHRFAIRQIVQQFVAEVDVLFLRMPFQVPSALTCLGRPKVVHVVNNVREIVAASTDYRGPWRLLARWMAWRTERQIRAIVHEPRTRLVSNGDEMWHRLVGQDGRVVVSSCLREREVVPRTNFDLHAPPRLLFVGYLRPEKGILDLLAAFDMVRNERSLRLTLVGAADRPTAAEQLVRQRISDSPFAADIELAGNVEFGDQLFKHFRDADVLILPSLSEGTPRVLNEARAFGCAAIATRVGGIPTVVDDGVDGLLVPPQNPAALANALRQLLTNDVLRRRLAMAGANRARQHTLESFADILVQEINAAAGRP